MDIFKHISEFLFPQKKEELYCSLTTILGFSPKCKNLGLYKQALQHKSVALRDEEGHSINNERLEFLGDAIIEAVASNYLFRKYPNRPEGFLTTARSKMVQRSTLGELSEKIGLDSLVKASIRGDAHNSYIGGNAFEALVGAIYLDRGYRYCQRFFIRLIIKGYINIERIVSEEQNFKSRLLEWSQKNHFTIRFESKNEGFISDKEDNPPFRGEVFIEDIKVGEGWGYSKKESHQKASEAAMNKIKSQPELKHQFMDAHEAAQTTSLDNLSEDITSNAETADESEDA